jgi:hypothetical protein
MKYLKIDVMNKDKSQMILIRISKAFKQQQQAEIFKAHEKQCEYPIIICGDMNNSVFLCIQKYKGNT